mmetsp:Transcript_37059/g.56941  ORF Transcript_37059/g.56941 Transcript_37059/m.56941 type:complete len:87 (-) Transcript_37059:303-563(-)
MMNWAAKHKTLALEQFGSRPGHRAIDQTLNKKLCFDIMRQGKRPGAICSNDAKSFYDRILHSVASLSMRRQGIPSSAIQVMFSTTQ